MVEKKKHIASIGQYKYSGWGEIANIDMDKIIPELVRNFVDKTYRNVKFTQGHQGSYIDQAPEFILGTVESLQEVGGKLLSDISMDEKAEELISSGKLTDVSIGFFSNYIDNLGVTRGATLFEVALVAEGFLKTDPFAALAESSEGVAFSKSSGDSNFKKDNIVYFSVGSAEKIEVKAETEAPTQPPEITEGSIAPLTGQDELKQDYAEMEKAEVLPVPVVEDEKITIQAKTTKEEEPTQDKETEVNEPVKLSASGNSFDRVEFARLKKAEFDRKIEDFANSFLLSRGGRLTEKFYTPIVELSKVIDQANWGLISKLLDQVQVKFTDSKVDLARVAGPPDTEEIISFARANGLEFYEAKKQLKNKI